MPNLFETMQAAHGGDAMTTLAQQFGLTPDQAQNAVSALMPAFSMGLQKQTENTDALGNLFQSIFGGPYAAAFDDPVQAAAPATVSAGSTMLNQMFGSQAATNQIAQHAANVSGLSSSLLQQMMPVIASMVIGGLLKGTNGNNGLGGILGQMMGGAQSGNIGDILGQMMGQGAPQPSQGQAGGPFGGGLGGILGQILGGMTAGQPQLQPQPAPQAQAQAAPANPIGDILSSMFQAGTQMQDAHVKGLQDIFDRMSGGPANRG